MHILVLNRCYPPEVGATGRVLRDLARVWVQRHRVTVLTGRPSDGPERYPYYWVCRSEDEGVVVERVGSTAFSRRRMFGRLADYLSYMVLAFLRTLTIRPRPDVLMAMTDPPLTSLIGAIVAKLRGIPWIYNIQDLHPDMAVAAGIVKPGTFVSLWERLHRWSLRQARRVVVLGEDMRDRVVAKGVDPDRVIVIRGGTARINPPADSDHPVIREIRGDFSFVLVHAGNIGFAGAWETLLEAFRQVTEREIGLVFVGDGSRRAWVEKQADGLPNVRFRPYYPETLLPYVLISADLHVVTLRRGLEGLVVPSKVYSVLMVGRPVLAIVPPESDVARIVQAYGCGLVTDPDDPGTIAQAIRWVRAHPAALAEMGLRARTAGQFFDRQRLAEEFMRAVETL
ncbi:MAG: glycosyltransferase family 4 protein [Acidobacteria bacterium]|nr:glycosyltransferase family 4 protein [Acidobacteriota bacterium]MDW7984456.1 glycosyltransferase family 4 protein [Acidobacteriota bacterium]